MANMVGTERSNIVAIADAVRNRTGESGDLTIGEIISGINDIEGGENLDTEISAQNAIIAEQDAKIAELAEVLASKASGGNTDYVVSVTIADEGSMNGAFYFDANSIIQQVVNSTRTVDALFGIVFTRTPMELINASGNYIQSQSPKNPMNTIRFLEDGGTAIVTM